MSHTIRNLFFATGFMVLGGIGSFGMQAIAQGGPGYRQGGGPGMGMMMADLDLTEEQEARFTELRQGMREMRSERMQARGAQGGGFMREVMASLESGEFDAKQIHRSIDERAAERTQEMHDMADKVIDFAETLTPEQRTLMAEHMDQMQSRRGERRGMRGGDCDGRGRGRSE